MEKKDSNEKKRCNTRAEEKKDTHSDTKPGPI